MKTGNPFLRHRLPRLVAAIALCLAALPATAAPGTLSNPRFGRLDIDDGLAQNSVYAIAQDRYGLLWLGTEDGLQRYDGYRFTLFRKTRNDDTGLQSSSIEVLYTDSRDDLWIGTYGGGIHRMRVDDHAIAAASASQHEEGLPANDIWSIAEDADGRIWFTSNNGPAYIEPGELRFQRLPLHEVLGGLAPNDAWYTVRDSGGRMWMAGHNLLAFSDDPLGKWTRVDLRGALGIDAEDFWITALAANPDGGVAAAIGDLLFMASADGELRLVRHLAKTPSAAAVNINAIHVDDTGHAWLATGQSGLFRVAMDDGETAHVQRDPVAPDSLASNRLSALFADGSGVLWIGTANAGVNSFDPRTLSMNHYSHHPIDANSLSDNSVWRFARVGTGDVWVATEKGLNRVDPDTGDVQRYRHEPGDPGSLADDYAATVQLDDEDRLWVAAGRSLDLYRPESDDFRHHPLPLEPYDSIVAFLPLAGRRFLVSTSLGTVVFDSRDGSAKPVALGSERHPDLAHATPLAFARADDNRTWVATDLGLLEWNDDSARMKDVMHDAWAELHGVNIQDVTVLHDARVALATEHGLAVTGTEPGSPIEWYGKTAGLPGGTLYAVRQDADGGVWVSSNQGLARLDLVTREVDRYNARDGLQGNEFSGGAAYVDAEGLIYFGGVNGFNVFDPRELRGSLQAPRATITGLTVLNGESEHRLLLPGPERVALDWRENTVIFEFTVTDFISPASNHFQARLLPLQETWIDLHDDHRFSFTEIPGGSYVFEVRGATRNGTWSDASSLQLDIERKPWLTWQACVVYLLAVIGLFIVFLRQYGERRAARARAQHEMRQREWVQSLYELADGLSHTLDRGEILATLFARLSESIKPTFAALYLETPRGFQVLEKLCADEDTCEMLSTFPERHPEVAAMLEQANSLQRLDSSRFGVCDESHRFDRCELIAVPLRLRDRHFLFLLLGRCESPFKEDDLKYVAAYANHATTALEKAALFNEVQALAIRDPLTGIANRRHFNERAEIELQRCRRYKRPFSIVMLDFDGFKQLNDLHGHAAGDEVLGRAGALLAEQLRKFDIVARYGGEEFVMCLPETDAAQARVVAERVRVAIQRMRTRCDGKELAITASLGIASSDDGDASLEELVREADRALYAAKAAGRNCTILAEEFLS